MYELYDLINKEPVYFGTERECNEYLSKLTNWGDYYIRPKTNESTIPNDWWSGIANNH